MDVIVTGVKRMLEVFTDYYGRLAHLDLRGLCPQLVTARIIKPRDNQIIQDTIDDSKVACLILDKVDTSLRAGVPQLFDRFLVILENDDDFCCNELANQMRGELSKNTTGTVTIA